MNKKIIIAFNALLILLSLPLFAYAQGNPPVPLGIPISTVILGLVATALNILWIIAVAFTIIMFTLSGFKYMTAQGDAGKVKEAHMAVIWGTVGTAVIVLAWSVIAVIRLQIGS